MGVSLLLGGVAACATGALFVRLRGAPCVGAAIGMSLYIGWASVIYVLARLGMPDLPIQRVFLALYAVIPLPIATVGWLGVISQRRRRLLLSLTSAFSLTLALPMMTFVIRWWIETGPLLLSFAVVPAAVFLWEAHCAHVYREARSAIEDARQALRQSR